MKVAAAAFTWSFREKYNAAFLQWPLQEEQLQTIPPCCQHRGFVFET